MNYPVRKVFITQYWGVNQATYAHLGLKGHNGIDLRIFDNDGNKALSGDLIAPHDGKIIEAALDSDGYGWYYKIENDIEGSILGHNKELLFKVGDTVKEGQLIGYTDNTGWSTGSHVHWGYYRKPRNRNDGYSGTCDPRPYIKPKEGVDMSANMYTMKSGKQLDLNNEASMKAACDVYDEVINQGLYVKKSEVDEQVKDKTAELSSKISDYAKKNKELEKDIILLKDDIENLQINLDACKSQVPEAPSMEDYTSGYSPTGRKITQVQGVITAVETSYKKD